ncbi:hypothetical protein FQN54_009985 [Arachnomyces sp. PD_36]|nr:hypothetical protein FQN54_009985 [Arachnomyces sp. PD_36]
MVNAYSDYNREYTNIPATLSGPAVTRIMYDSEQYWAFILHSACWDILLLRLRADERNKDVVAKHLFFVLLSSTWDESTCLIKGIDFGDAALLRKARYQLTASDDGPYSYFNTDPCEIHGPEIESLADCVNGISSAGNVTETYYSSLINLQEDFLSRLPLEIIHMIISWLSLSDIFNLRLASKWVALGSTIEALPRSFWSSRFRVEFEMGYALPYVEWGDHFIDWRERFFTIKRIVKSPHGFTHLRHRQQVWTTMSPIYRLIEPYVRNRERHGILATWDNLLPLSGGRSRNLTVGHVFRGLSVPGPFPEVLFEGCREIEMRSLIWPQLCGIGDYAIGISLISLEKGTFVSGIRILQYYGQVEAMHAQHSLGMTDKASETLIRVEANIPLEGFEVGVCPEGIVALKPILGGSHPTTYVGSAFKLTALGIIETERGSGPLEGVDELHLTEQVAVEDTLWSPSIPPHDASIHVFPTPATSGKFQPLMNVEFGGADGSRLCALTRIVAHMDRLPYLIKGFEVFYSQSESRLYGSRGLLERSFLVDGVNGERIDEAKIQPSSELEHVDTIQSIEISTNWGNSVTFTYPEIQTTEHHSPLRELRPSPGEVVTGFVVGLGIRTPILRTFGLQSLSISPTRSFDKYASVATMPALSHSLVSAPDLSTATIHKFSVRTLYTRALLNNARRIRFSRGINGRVREETDISGLWIEFHGSRPPAIVGQWLTETDSFELGESERIVEISSWVTREATEAMNGPRLGKVVGMCVSTSLQRSSGFIGTKKPGAMRLRFRGNRFEKLHTIMWAYNHEADHLRVLTKPISGNSDLILCPKNTPTWIVPEKLLWEDTHEGHLDGLSTVQIHSKPGAIIGLSFIYISGASSEIGCTDGRVESFDARDRRLTCLQVHSTKDIIKELTFHTEPANDQNDGVLSIMKQKSHTFIASNPGEPPPPNHSMYDLLESSSPRIQHASSRSTHYIHQEEHVSARRTSFVGIWGIGDELRKLGIVLRNCDAV